MESGRNNGITNLIDLPGLGAGAMFEGKCYGYKASLSVASKRRLGRGSTKWGKSRPLSSGGGLAVDLRLQLSGWPAPDKWRGQVGTVLIQLDEGRTETLTVRVESFTHQYKEANADVHAVTLGCVILDDPVFAGFASADEPQPAATEPTKADQEQWGEGTTKTYDSQGLLTAATRLTDLWGGTLPDDDSGEATRLAAAVAAAQPPITGLKLKTATFQRDSDDGGQVSEIWALTDSAEDVTNPLTETTLDANHLASEATAAAINATPATPAGDSFVTRTTTTRELNDAKILTTVTYGLRDTLDDVQMPETVTGRDNGDLKDQSQVVRVNTSSTPPAVPAAPNGQHVGTDTVQLNRIEWKHTFRYANNTSSQELILPRTVVEIDPSTAALEGKDAQVILTATSTPPATPTPNPATLVLRRRASRRVAGTPEQWEHVFYFAATTSQEDVELPKTRTAIDVSGLDQENFVCKVFLNGSPPTPPTPPSGMVIADYFDVPETSLVSHRVWRLCFVSNAQRLTLPHYENAVDPNGIETVKRSAVIWDSAGAAPGTPTAPAGLKLTALTDVAIPTHSTNQIRVYRWAVIDSIDKLVLPTNWTLADPNSVISEGEVSAYDAAAPAVPSGYKDRGVVGHYITPTKLLNVRKFGLRSTLDDLTMPHARGGGDWLDGNRWSEVSAPTSAASAATQAAAAIAANLSDKTFNSVDVEKIHDNLARVVINRQDDNVVVEFEMREIGHVHVPARLSGTDVYIFVKSLQKLGQNSGGTATWEGLIVPQRYLGVRMNFSIVRRTTGASVPLNLSFAGAANASAFLGLPANTVVYTGAGGRARVDTSGNAVGVSFMAYKFFYDSLGFFDLGDISVGAFQKTGSFATIATAVAAGNNWVKATDLNFHPALLNTGNFSGAYT